MSEIYFSPKMEKVIAFFEDRPNTKITPEELAPIIYDGSRPVHWRASVIQFMLKLRLTLAAANRPGPDRVSQLGSGSPIVYMWDPAANRVPRIKDKPMEDPKKTRLTVAEIREKRRAAYQKVKAKRQAEIAKLAPFYHPGKKNEPFEEPS